MTRPWVVLALLLPAVGCQKPVKPGDPLRELSRAERDRFDRGKVVFDSVFTPETGLGPLFNATGCGECHENPAGGRGDEVEVHATAFHAPVCDPLAQEGGPVIQQHTTPALKQALGIDQEPFPPSATARAMRTSPVIFGRGLLDLVPDSVLLAYADPDDRNHDGVRGRPNRFADGRIGRFGRKGFVPTLREFNAGAFAAEMSVTNPAQPTEEDVGGKPLPAGVDPAPDPEINQEQLDLTDDFVRFLAPPTPLKLGKDGRHGRDVRRISARSRSSICAARIISSTTAAQPRWSRRSTCMGARAQARATGSRGFRLLTARRSSPSSSRCKKRPRPGA